MTSPISAKSSASDRRPLRRRRAFTLIEMLVVAGILVVLVGILVPMVAKARKTAARTRMASDLQAISTALDAYKTDHGDYPRVAYDPQLTGPTEYDPTTQRPNPLSGAQVLCRALVGQLPALEQPTPAAGAMPIQDSANGPGFRLRAQGQVYGPYIAADRFKVYPMVVFPSSDPPTPERDGLRMVLLDGEDRPILYFPRRTPAPPAAQYLLPIAATGSSYPPAQAALVTAEQYAYDVYDNVTYFQRATDTGGVADAARRIHILLGDYNPTNPGTSFDGDIDAGEGQAASAPYLLWMAGPDGQFGTTEPVTPSAKDVNTCDDVTNFAGGQ